MRLIEAWRREQLKDLFQEENPTGHLLTHFPRLAACYENIDRFGDGALAEYLALEGLTLDDMLQQVDSGCLDPDDEPGATVTERSVIGECSTDYELPDTETVDDEDHDPVEDDYLAAVEQAITRIIGFYQNEKIQSWYATGEHDELTGQKVTPIERVAVLMPSCWNFAPISLMMSIIPAIIAGSRELYVNLPPRKDACRKAGETDELFLWLCRKLGISRIFRLPEVPAVFAFARGTQTVPKVDKIVGAGSLDVRSAGAMVSTSVGVKILPERNDTVIFCDETGNESFIVADIFAAAEDPNMNRITILTTSTVKATEITAEISKRLKASADAVQIKELLRTSGAVVLTRNVAEALELIGRHPPKYLSIFARRPLELLARIKDAGVLYLGDYSPAGMENYFASSSNLIPSGRYCRFTSPLDVNDFVKKTSVIHYTRRQVEHVYNMVNPLARKDNLPFHRESFRIRMKHDKAGPR